MSTSTASTDQVYDAFISYGRADSKSFVTKLQDHLTIAGFRVWLDCNDIPLGVDFQNQIDDGIEKADNFLFIISPHSINSPYCCKEIELAIERNKRIIPLLHVEQIDWQTWQQRHPNGSEAEWQDYQAKGLHSSFPNMHPAISKINWVYFREGIDHFETALTGLQALLERHRDYVRHHTVLLNQALTWERHQKRTRYLLIGEERQQAEAWLKQRFEEEQAPCEPTPLHCEFICQSIKNANNLMTQVFLSHAEADSALTEQIRRRLLREAISVWSSQTDIQTGEQFEEAIRRGIEQADTIVYLISPDALQSRYCQQEVDYALSLHKRIIPLLVQPTDLEQIPPQLRSLQFIDFTNNTTDADYRQDVDQLLKVLREDAAYYEEHKILLSKALKWERQSCNPSILLRGYNLHHAEDWLKGASQRSQHVPTPLQKTFITESLRQPPAASVDVFISYSRVDSDLARRLNDELQIRGKTTWFDQESIASGTDFQQEIYRGIESADNFLFILSPRSVNSPYCADEVEYAARLNKRFITVLYRAVNPAELHPELAKVQWIDFNQREGDFYANFNQLVRTLETDREHVHSHTKWSQRALEWRAHDRSEDLLLRGSELVTATAWLQETAQQQKQPAATELQQEFIEASTALQTCIQQQEQERQQRELQQAIKARKTAQRTTVGALIGGAVMAGLAVFSGVQVRQAEIQQIRALRSSAEAELVSGMGLDALMNSLRASKTLQRSFWQAVWPEADLREQSMDELSKALYAGQERNRLEGHHDTVWSVVFSPDGQTLASASEDKTVKLWNLQGKSLTTLLHTDAVYSVVFSPDGQTLASASKDKTAKLWNRQGKLLATLPHTDAVYSVVFSPDGQTLASTSWDRTVKLWNLQGKSLGTLPHTDAVYSVVFSPDGQTLASASEDKTVKLWNRQGKLLATLPHTDAVRRVVFSPDGQTIASASWDKSVKLWNRQGKLLATLPHTDAVHSVVFSPDGQTLASAGEDKTVKLWNRQGKLLATLPHTDAVLRVVFSPDGQTLASASSDKTVKLWNRHSKSLLRLPHTDAVLKVVFSPDGQTLASASEDKTVKLWNSHGKLLATLPHTDAVYSAVFSPDGQTLASASEDKTVKLWNSHGKLLATLPHTDAVYSVVFSPDGQTLASASKDKTAKLWNLQGKSLVTLSHTDTVNSVVFSPDGQTLASAGEDKTIKLWNRHGKPLAILTHADTVNRVVFSPNSQTLASASKDKTVKLWNLQGKSLVTLSHQDWGWSVVFSPDGQTLASASRDQTVKLWNLQGKLLATLPHTDPVWSVVFSPDGQTLASAGRTKAVKLWNRQGKPLATLLHTDVVNSVVFSPDGRTLASASEDKTVKLWKVEGFDALLERGCNWVRDYLTNNPNVAAIDRQICDVRDTK